MEYIPALSLLIAVMLIVLAVIWKFEGNQLLNIIVNSNFVLIVAVFLFCVVGIVHLFEPQGWTADLLKVIVGVLVGAATASNLSGEPSRRTGGVDISGTVRDSEVAGRDLNKMIDQVESMYGDIKEVRDSAFNNLEKVSNLYGEIREVAQATGEIREVANVSGDIREIKDSVIHAAGVIQQAEIEENEYLFNTIYGRSNDEFARQISDVTRHWEAEGWTLDSISSDYNGLDGMLLLFKRRRSTDSDDERRQPEFHWGAGSFVEGY